MNKRFLLYRFIKILYLEKEFLNFLKIKFILKA